MCHDDLFIDVGSRRPTVDHPHLHRRPTRPVFGEQRWDPYEPSAYVDVHHRATGVGTQRVGPSGHRPTNSQVAHQPILRTTFATKISRVGFLRANLSYRYRSRGLSPGELPCPHEISFLSLSWLYNGPSDPRFKAALPPELFPSPPSLLSLLAASCEVRFAHIFYRSEGDLGLILWKFDLLSSFFFTVFDLFFAHFPLLFFTEKSVF